MVIRESLRVAVRTLVLSVASAGVAGLMAAPALAAPGLTDLVVNVSPGSTQIQLGGAPGSITVTVRNQGPVASAAGLSISVPNLREEVEVSAPGCTGTSRLVRCAIASIPAGDSSSVTVTFSPPADGSLPAGQSSSGAGTASVDATSGDNNPGNNNASYTLILSGPDKQKSVTEVSGTVNEDKSGKAVSAATVAISDSAGHQYNTGTDETGRFVYRASQNAPIVPGQITITATKAGFRTVQTRVDGQAGQPIAGVSISLVSSASASPSSSAPASQDPGAADTVPPARAAGSSGDDSTSGFLWIFVVLGLLLVALAVAIVIFFVRRKEPADDEDGPLDPRRPSPRPDSGGPPAGVYRSNGGAPMADTPTVTLNLGAEGRGPGGPGMDGTALLDPGLTRAGAGMTQAMPGPQPLRPLGVPTAPPGGQLHPLAAPLPSPAPEPPAPRGGYDEPAAPRGGFDEQPAPRNGYGERPAPGGAQDFATTAMDRADLDRVGLDRAGLDRAGLDRADMEDGYGHEPVRESRPSPTGRPSPGPSTGAYSPGDMGYPTNGRGIDPYPGRGGYGADSGGYTDSDGYGADRSGFGSGGGAGGPALPPPIAPLSSPGYPSPSPSPTPRPESRPTPGPTGDLPRRAEAAYEHTMYSEKPLVTDDTPPPAARPTPPPPPPPVPPGADGSAGYGGYASTYGEDDRYSDTPARRERRPLDWLDE